MGRIYLGNAFSLSMLPGDKSVIEVQMLSKEEFADMLKKDVISILGHKGTADLINELFGTHFGTIRAQVQLFYNDTLLVVQILTRLPEGQVLSKKEMEDLLLQGKIAFYKVTRLH